jgi:formylglycine-generating enzyme required for sulfatase activity
MSTKHQRAFISYSRVNKEFASKLAGRLRSAGYLVWFDLLDIPTGSRWDDEVERALRESPLFLIILTPAAIASENVKDEIGYAIDHGKRILPVLLENCDVPLRLRRFQYVDFTSKTFEEGFEGARGLLDDIVGGSKEEPKERSRTESKPQAESFEFQRNMAVKASETLKDGKQFFQNRDYIRAARAFREVLSLIPDHEETKKLLATAESKITELPASGPAQSKTMMSQPTPKRLSLKSVIFGFTGMILMAGIIGSVIWFGGNGTPPVSTVGMVDIPSGRYTPGADKEIETTEFWIDRYEITNGDYKKFVDSTDSHPPEYWSDGEIPPGKRDHPVMQVTWKQATEYCDWVGKRLPTEAEWEIAARGPFGWQYPWGNDPDRVGHKTDGTSAVTDNPANRSYYGTYFMSGNVWEWVSEPYTASAEDEYVMRGGAYGPLDVLIVALSVPDDSLSNKKTGFRCAASGENIIREHDNALAIRDDFETSNSNWPGIDMGNFLFDYHEVGFYHVEAREANKFVPAFYEHDTFSNFVLETEVFVDRLNTDNQQGNFLYGLGIQVADDKFYAFVISAQDRKWQVFEGPYNKDRFIGDVSDLTVINEGNENSIMGTSSEQGVDRLTVIVNGNNIIYYVNGDLVNHFTMEDHQKLKVGFVVETLSGVKRVHIHYNWVSLQNIDPFVY